MSEAASPFKTALDTCHNDSQAFVVALSGVAGVYGPGMKLVTESKKHARELLDAAYEVTARLKEKEDVSSSDVKSLEEHVRAYYDLNDVAIVSRLSLQNMRYHLDEATKLFASLKPHLTEVAAKETQPPLATVSRKIFIVHGHDENNKNALKNMLTQWGFEPVILAEQPHRGQFLLEKLLKHTPDVGFVFVLLTPDDVGATRQDLERLEERIKGISLRYTDVVELGLFISEETKSLMSELEGTLRPRARQNVMFEYGLCIGYLGRERVCVLLRGDLEMPSDVLGFGYHSFEKSVLECEEKIKRELAVIYDF